MSAVAGCWHCGEPLPENGNQTALVGAVLRPVCCAGCRAAAEWIEHLGLGDYYRMRSAPAPIPGAVPDDDAWLRPELWRHVVRDLGHGRREAMLLIEGLRCTGCVWLIERSLAASLGVESVSINAAACRARVVWQADRCSLHDVLAVLARTGYRARPLDATALDDSRRRESRDALKRLLVAAFGAMQAMMFAAVLYLGGERLEPSTRDLFQWLGCLVAAPVVFYSARPFFRGAARGLRARRLVMDVPVAIAIAITYAASLIEAVRGDGVVYFDSIAMFVFLLLAGRHVEMRARHRTRDLTDSLARSMPPFAERRRADGSLERIGIHELVVGDLVHLGEGSAVPADGTLESEVCRVDEALLTGESAGIVRRRGERLVAGSVLVDGTAELRIDRLGTDTVLAQIVALTDRALTQRTRLGTAAERAAAHFVAWVLVLSALTALAWSIVDPGRVFPAALAVLVVSCPCALALAAPASVTRLLAVLARHGVLVVRPDAIEAFATATHVVFDKTGTLTEPRLVLADVECVAGVARDDALRWAGALARESRHPIAQAVLASCRDVDLPAVAELDVSSGLGIAATTGGRRLRLGRADFALANRPGADQSAAEDALLLTDENGVLASLRLGEQLRRGARETVEALRAQGLVVAIASGDVEAKVRAVGVQLGIAEWRASLRPADKLAWLETLRREGARVVVVGDGINDAPVLAGADVGIALSAGSDLAQARSDVIVASDRLTSIPKARELSRRTLAVLAQNHRWALAYNLAAIPLAALGVVPPWLAALGMSASSIAVVLNSQRIGRDETPPVAVTDPGRSATGVA
jgi:Cu2+-exporting ATPase